MTRLLLLAPLVATLLPAQEYQLGSRVGDFNLKDTSGAAVSFSSLRGDTTVVTFISVQCPVSNSYNERMVALYTDYAAKGVKFVFLNANSTETAPAVARHAAEHGFPFKVYKDENNVVADRFGASVTPEVYVLDSGGVLRYHGSIDDSQVPARVQKQRLREALDSVLAGKPVATPQYKAFGCSIKRVNKS